MPSSVIMKEGARLARKDDADGGGGPLRRCVGAVRVAACLGTGIAILFGAGCSGSSNNIAQPLTQSSTPATPTASPTASVSQQVLAQYQTFWSALTPASRASAGARRGILAQVATDPELSSLLSGIARERARGRAFYGVDVPRAHVSQILMTQGIAVVDDCQNSAGSGVVDLSSGQRLTKGVPRNHVVSTMHRGSDGIWRVASVEYPNTSC